MATILCKLILTLIFSIHLYPNIMWPQFSVSLRKVIDFQFIQFFSSSKIGVIFPSPLYVKAEIKTLG